MRSLVEMGAEEEMRLGLASAVLPVGCGTRWSTGGGWAWWPAV
jgi:hypothetical protein